MGPCPHFRHTERILGAVTQHVCFDCAMVIEDCPEFEPDVVAVTEVAPVVEDAQGEGI